MDEKFDQRPPTQEGVPTPRYIQRVFSSGLNAWCYYTQPEFNPNPLPHETTPHWTGSIMAHEILTKA